MEASTCLLGAEQTATQETKEQLRKPLIQVPDPSDHIGPQSEPIATECTDVVPVPGNTQ